MPRIKYLMPPVLFDIDGSSVVVTKASEDCLLVFSFF